MSYRRLRLLALTLGLFLTSCSFGSALKLDNDTGDALIPYPVVTTPPPPHREADAANTVADQDDTKLDPEGFNPVFYQEGVTDPTKANGIYLGFDLFDADPLLIQFKVFHYQVPPGEEGTDPALQPILLHQGVQEIEDTDITVLVSTQVVLGGMGLPPGGWRVDIKRN